LRQEVYLLLVALLLGFKWGENSISKVLLNGSWHIVMLAELLNSAVEAVVDRIGIDLIENYGNEIIGNILFEMRMNCFAFVIISSRIRKNGFMTN
jgi:diacylglycerol kinase (ATP)